jgi:hypothetical protein
MNVRLRRPSLSAAACVAAFATGALLSGYGDPAGSGSAGAPARAATMPAAAPSGMDATGTEPRGTAGIGGMGFGDDPALERAITACRAGDFRGFFDAFVRAETVRNVFTAPTVVVARYGADGRPPARGETPRDDFDDFPIRVEDVYWRPASSVSEAGGDEYLQLEFDESQSRVFAVSWTRVRYDGRSEGGDDLGTALTPDGIPLQPGGFPDGRLLFRPHQDCWRLVADERFDRRPGDR